MLVHRVEQNGLSRPINLTRNMRVDRQGRSNRIEDEPPPVVQRGYLAAWKPHRFELNEPQCESAKVGVST